MTAADRRAAVLAEGRRADTARRRQGVLTVLAQVTNDGNDMTLSAIARTAGVDRSFFYRHPDLLGQLRSLQVELPAGAASTTVTRASLRSDLDAAQHRAARFAARVRQLEDRLSELLGEQVWRDSGLGPLTTSNSSISASRYWKPNLSMPSSSSTSAPKSSPPRGWPIGSS